MKITLSKENFCIPIAYQSILQGTIYGLLSKNDIGNMYHNEGYHYDRKIFKCFVFSQLFGKYKIVNNNMIFENDFYFYISSQDERFLNEIYKTLIHNDFIVLHRELVKIMNIKLFDIKPFYDIKNMTIKTLSPILIYSTSQKYSTYYKPSDKQSLNYILENIHDKSKAYGYPIQDIQFDIVKINYEKKRMVKFKQCIYKAYLCELEVKTNYETLLFIYNCGLSCKNSCGFGMIEVVDEESHLSV